MALHALSDIGDAIDATKSLLFPFAASKWLRLAFVVLFIGGGGGGLNGLRSLNSFNGQSAPPESSGGGVDTTAADITDPLTDAGPELFAVVAAVVLLFVLFGVLSNFMEFVFTQSLIDREVHIRQSLGANLGNGVQLLLFRLVLNLVSLLFAALVLTAVFFGVFGGDISNVGTETLFAGLPFIIGFVLLGSVVVGLIAGFTNVFVVPLMLHGEQGILAGWRRLLSSIPDHLKQYVAYVVFSVVLATGANLVGSILISILSVALLIPFGIVGAVIWFAIGHGTVGLTLLGVVTALFVLALFVIANVIKVPLQSFLRYYAMLVLGDIDESLDPIPEVRDDIRTEESDAGDSAAADGA